MKSLSACASTGLEWVQPRSGQRYWELVSEGELVAKLAFEGAFGSPATLLTGDGEWQMRRERGVSWDVLVYEPDSPEPIGRYHPHWTAKDGVLILRDQREYTWTATNFWNTRFEIRDYPNNTVLMRYAHGLNREGFNDLFKLQAIMDIPGTSVRAADLALLSGWGFYQVVLHRQQSFWMGRNRWFMFAAPGAPSRRARDDGRY